MRSTVKNFAIEFGLFALVFMIGTCHVNNVNKPEKIPLDTALLNSYKEKVNALQDRLRILSGLYGILKPLDLMQAYRLEMGGRESKK